VRDIDRDAPGGDTAMGLHNGIVRAVLREHNGHEIKHTGKGIFSRFVSPSDAVEAAIAIRQRMQDAAGPEVAQSLLGNTAPGEDPSITPLLSQQAQAAITKARNGGIVADTRVSAAYRGPSGLQLTPVPVAADENLALAELEIERLPGPTAPVA